MKGKTKHVGRASYMSKKRQAVEAVRVGSNDRRQNMQLSLYIVV